MQLTCTLPIGRSNHSRRCLDRFARVCHKSVRLLKNFLAKVISLFESKIVQTFALVASKRKSSVEKVEIAAEKLTNFLAMAKFLGMSIIDCYKYFSEGNTFAPYFALVQSSGTGKTTCMQLIENLFPTRYINLGRKDDMRIRMNYSEENKEYDKEYLKGLVEIAKEVNETQALELMKKHLLKCVVDLKEPLFFKGLNESTEIPKDEYVNSGIKCICLDEAKILCETPAHYKTGEKRNVFELLRKALASLGRDHKIVLVVADTVSTVANFVSPYGSLSRRIKDLPSTNLFPVVFHMPFSDLKITEIQENEKKKPEFSLDRLSLYGRPLWSNVKDKSRLMGLIEFKLVNQIKDQHFFQKHMAVLGSRLALQILEGNLADQLVADSLAHCVHISPCRKLVKCIFQSEPLVSEVATQVMYKSFDDHVNSLKKSFQSRTIEIGRTGEILAQLILLLAHDYSYARAHRFSLLQPRISSTKNANPVLLTSLLQLLVTKNLDSEKAFFTRKVGEKANKEYLCVFFNHFIELSKTQNITVDLLKKGMHRCCAFQAKEGTEGIDLIIPCFWSNSGELAGVFSVQVKAIAGDNQRPSENARYLSKLLPNHFLEQNDLVEFGEKNLRSFGLVLHIRGDDKKEVQGNTTNFQIFNDKALLIKLQSYVTPEGAPKFLDYLTSLDHKKFTNFLSEKQIKEIKKLLHIKSLRNISEKLLNLQLQEKKPLQELLNEPTAPYIIQTLNFCCNWNNSQLANLYGPLRNSIKDIVELVQFLPAIKNPFSCTESLDFYELQFGQIKNSLLPVHGVVDYD